MGSRSLRANGAIAAVTRSVEHTRLCRIYPLIPSAGGLEFSIVNRLPSSESNLCEKTADPLWIRDNSAIPGSPDLR